MITTASHTFIFVWVVEAPWHGCECFLGCVQAMTIAYWTMTIVVF